MGEIRRVRSGNAEKNPEREKRGKKKNVFVAEPEGMVRIYVE